MPISGYSGHYQQWALTVDGESRSHPISLLPKIKKN